MFHEDIQKVPLTLYSKSIGKCRPKRGLTFHQGNSCDRYDSIIHTTFINWISWRQQSHLNPSPMGLINQNANANPSMNSSLANQCINESTIAALFASLNNSSLSTLVASGLLQVDLGPNSNDNNNSATINSSQLVNPLLAQLQQLEKYGGNLNTTTVAALSQQLESLRQAQNNPQSNFQFNFVSIIRLWSCVYYLCSHGLNWAIAAMGDV